MEKEKKSKSVAVVIANWNGKKVLEKCLKSLQKQTFSDFDVYVVDNGSEDGSCKMIEKKFPEVVLTKLSCNTGFAKANNIGFRQAIKRQAQSLKYICPLNNDIELAENYLEELVKSAQRHQKKNKNFGILAAKLLFFYERDRINSVGTVIFPDGSGMERGFREKDQGQYEKEVEIFGGCGAAVMYNIEMLKAISFKNKEGQECFFDEDFFAYYEDLDLNFRSRLAGFRAFYVPKAKAFHVHSYTGKSFSAFKSFHVHRNQLFLLAKDYPMPFLFLAFLLLPLRYLLLLVSAFFVKKGPAAKLQKSTGKKSVFKITLSCWQDFFKHLPELIQKRKEIQKKRQVSLLEFGSWFLRFRANFFKMIFGE